MHIFHWCPSLGLMKASFVKAHAATFGGEKHLFEAMAWKIHCLEAGWNAVLKLEYVGLVIRHWGSVLGEEFVVQDLNCFDALHRWWRSRASLALVRTAFPFLVFGWILALFMSCWKLCLRHFCFQVLLGVRGTSATWRPQEVTAVMPLPGMLTSGLPGRRLVRRMSAAGLTLCTLRVMSVQTVLWFAPHLQLMTGVNCLGGASLCVHMQNSGHHTCLEFAVLLCHWLEVYLVRRSILLWLARYLHLLDR